MRDLRVLYSENVYRHPKARHLRASRLVAESDEPVFIEVDGEPLGRLPLEITALPRRLRMLVPPGSRLL
jgi:diacylglycerol kinase family enzyme